jgi:hypothetical protein
MCKSLFFLLTVWLSSFMLVRPVSAGPCSPDSEAPGIFVPSRGCFELGIGYQYAHFDVFGKTFHNHEYNLNFDTHLFDPVTGASGRLTVGLEGDLTAGFGGHTSGTPSLKAKSLFLGAGPRVALVSRSRIEPWIHGLVGWEHLRFTQGPVLGSNSALGYVLGGGVDIGLGPRAAWRIQGDYVGTHYQSDLQSNYSVGTGIVLYF